MSLDLYDRPFEPADHAAVARIARPLGRARWTRKQLAEYLGLPGGYARVIAERARPAHAIGWFLLIDTPEHLYLANIAVAAEFQRRGVAAYGLRCIERYGREHGYRRIALDVPQDNAAARALYLAHGYRAAAAAARLPRDQDHRMTKTLRR
ncbi:MAG: GNAT family N-acetyltransferase [Planctomycetes bacterium]|nr:GNAT family N-acetyltransferase [Planctomycetota bacterium]